MDSPVSFAGGVNTSLRMCAVEGEQFLIARRKENVPPSLLHIYGVELASDFDAIILTKEEKFALYEQLEQNINIHHDKTGNWFLSPRADFMLRKEMRQAAFWVWLRVWIGTKFLGGVL